MSEQIKKNIVLRCNRTHNLHIYKQMLRRCNNTHYTITTFVCKFSLSKNVSKKVWFCWSEHLDGFQWGAISNPATFKFFIRFLNISFTLYPAHSRVGRRNLVLRHSVPHFPPSFGGIACWVAELNAALCLDTRAKKWKYKCKKIFYFLEWGSNPQPLDFTVTLCAPAPRLASKSFLNKY